MVELWDVVIVARNEEGLDEVSGSVVREMRSDPRCGAVSTFFGITRGDVLLDGKQVIGLEFQAHAPLAEAAIREIVERCRKQIPDLLKVYIHHQLGYVPVNDTNVFIAVSSSHRGDAFRAVEYLMDQMKAMAPIWKKEIYHDQSHVWKENSEFHSSSLVGS